MDISILPDLLKLGDLGIQYCLKSEKAFQALREEHSALKEEKQILNIFSVTEQREKPCML